MKTKGILITVNDNYKPKLSEIIQEIDNGDSLHWSILYLWVIGSLGDQIDEDEINSSNKGVLISWSDLILASKSQSQIIDLLLIGCSDMDLIHRYESDQDMYEIKQHFFCKI